MPPDVEPRESKRTTALALGLLFLVALALRLPGLGYMLPHLPEPDGVKFLAQLEAARTGNLDVEPTINLTSYPALVPRVASLVPEPAGELAPGAPLDAHMERAARDYYALRLASALLASLLAPLAFLLARRFVSFPAACFAGVLVAASSLHLWFSTQARPHASAAAFTVLALLAALDLRRKNRGRDYALAGVALAFAVGSLQSGVALAFPLLAALLLRDERGGRHSFLRALGGLALALLLVSFFYPFAFTATPVDEPGELTVGDQGFLNLSGHTIGLWLFNGMGFERVARALVEYDPWLTALGALGTLACGVFVFARRAVRASDAAPGAELDVRRERDAGRELRRDLVVVLAYVLAYGLAIGLYRRSYQRFAIPLVPFLALAAAGALELAWSRRSSGRARSNVAFAVVAAVLALPAVVLAVGIARARAAPDTATLAARWITENVDPAARIAVVPALELPLATTDDALRANRALLDDPSRPWFRYEASRAPGALPAPRFDLRALPIRTDEERMRVVKEPAAFLREFGAQYVVVEVWEGRRFPMLRALRAGARELGDLVYRVAADAEGPGQEGLELPLGYQDDEFTQHAPWTWRALHAKGFGPTLEVYRVR